MTVQHHAAKRRTSPWMIVSLSVFGAFVLMCGVLTIVSFALPTDATTQRMEPRESPPPTATQAVDSVPIVSVREVRIETNVLNDTFTAVEVEVHNTTGNTIYVGPLDWHAHDVDGFKHEATYGPSATRGERLPGMYLDPGDATTGTFHLQGEVVLRTVTYQRWRTDDPATVEIE